MGGGRLSTNAGAVQITTIDGGVPSLSGLSDIMDGAATGFVEVVGTKASDSVGDAAGITPLGDNVDAELWEEALKMARLPQLRALFEPELSQLPELGCTLYIARAQGESVWR